MAARKKDDRRSSLLGNDDDVVETREQTQRRRSSIFENTVFDKLFRRGSNAESEVTLHSNLTEALDTDSDEADAAKYHSTVLDASLLAGYLEEDLKREHPDHEAKQHAHKTFVHYHRLASQAGAAHAKFVVGSFYQFGFKDLPIDQVAALKWYKDAALEGDLRAVNNIGVMLCHGEGLPKDEVRGMQWLEIAAEANDENSQLNLSILKTVSEHEAHRNHEEAIGILQRLVEAYPSKQVYNNLGCMYCRGFGVEQNYEVARDYFLQAVEFDSKIACYNLGVMEKNGLGCRPSSSGADRWFREARDDIRHEDYKCVIAAKDPTKLLMLTTMTYYIPTNIAR